MKRSRPLPKEKSAWACGTCGKLFSKDKYGKHFAEVCCTCATPGCDEIPERMGGLGQFHCRRCAAKKNLDRAEEHVASANDYLVQAKKEWERYASPSSSETKSRKR